jgi:4-amino-4-deoxy-L-arabinose transferase-like glycosyltransferase
MVFWIARRLLPMPLALTASALTAISPHLVTMNIYLLSETLFCFLVVLTMLLMATTTEKSGMIKQALVGLALGAAALTHPMLLYFVIPLTIFLLHHWGWKPGWKKVAAVAHRGIYQHDVPERSTVLRLSISFRSSIC